MAKIPVLSPREKALIQETINIVRQGRQNTPLRSDEEGESFWPNDVYIVYPQEEIPALESADEMTGTGNSDKPGSALCDIYSITSDDEGASILTEVGRDELVYNLDSEPLSIGWIVAVKDKFGSYVAVLAIGASGGNARAILTEPLTRGSVGTWTSATMQLLIPNGTDTGWVESAGTGTGNDNMLYDDGIGHVAGVTADPIPAGTEIHVTKIHGKWFYSGGGPCDTSTGTG